MCVGCTVHTTQRLHLINVALFPVGDSSFSVPSYVRLGCCRWDFCSLLRAFAFQPFIGFQTTCIAGDC